MFGLDLVEIGFVFRIALHRLQEVQQTDLGKHGVAQFFGNRLQLLVGVFLIVGEHPAFLVGAFDGERLFMVGLLRLLTLGVLLGCVLSLEIQMINPTMISIRMMYMLFPPVI